MFIIDSGAHEGLEVRGAGGRRYKNYVDTESSEPSITPYLDIQFESDMRPATWSRSLRVGRAAETASTGWWSNTVWAKLDTGADSNYMHDSWLRKLGLRPGEKEDEVHTATRDRKIGILVSMVSVRLVGFEDLRFMIRVGHSPTFSDGLMNIGLGAIAPYFGVVLDRDYTVLFLR